MIIGEVNVDTRLSIIRLSIIRVECNREIQANQRDIGLQCCIAIGTKTVRPGVGIIGSWHMTVSIDLERSQERVASQDLTQALEICWFKLCVSDLNGFH